MINIEFGPSTILGIFIVFGGVILYFLRSLKPTLARDSDIFFSSLALLSGGILIFQGWRLDPILLFGQMLSSGTAIFFLLEAIQLREQKNISSDEKTNFTKKINLVKDLDKENFSFMSKKRNTFSKYKSLLDYTKPMDYNEKIKNNTEKQKF